MRDAAPLCIDLFCGLGGWAEGFLAEGYRVVGFDVVRHDYGFGAYPGHLVLQDVLTLHGENFTRAACIVASPPCQAYSYRAMPWSRTRSLPPPDNSLFESCFRIQRQACAAAGRHIPLVVENVRGAERWVGRARGHYGSFYLWGDVPALLPGEAPRKVADQDWTAFRKTGAVSAHWTMSAAAGFAGTWFHGGNPMQFLSSRSASRRAASALIAKVPLPLARHIATCFKYSIHHAREDRWSAGAPILMDMASS